MAGHHPALGPTREDAHPGAGSGWLHERVAAQAARTPEAVAVLDRRGSSTYAELEARANRLAHRLAELGVGPEVAVGVCLERDAGMVAGVLGVLKAGGAYVPLDPAYPPARLAAVAADAGLAVVVSSARLASLLPPGPATVLVDRDPALAAQPATPPAVAVAGASVAYVLYTSGSTGRPKGVAVTHASARALVDWALGAYAPPEREAVLAATSLGFDLSVFELFVPLSGGGRVVVAADVLELGAVAAAGVSLLNTVPSAMAELLALGPLPPSVRVVNLAGEALPRALVDRLYASSAVERVANLYGPTEDTTYSTVAWLSPHDPAPPPIGHPLPGTQAHVLDDRLGPLPPGAVGELYLGGAGLARGYHRRPALTAERFVPDPFGPPGARLYRTGDRVRRGPDGALEFLGRLDDQVKIRGFRVEPAEAEAALAACAGVRQSAVVARDDGGGLRLVAYVVADGPPPSPAALRAGLREVLPAHLVPAAFVAVESLPRTVNGKLDRAALPPPAPEPSPAPPLAPRTPTEARVAEVWAQVLGRRDFGVHDPFLDLGGHSLLATQVVARLRRNLGVELRLCDLFDAPTVAGLAARVDQAQLAGARGDGR